MHLTRFFNVAACMRVLLVFRPSAIEVLVERSKQTSREGDNMVLSSDCVCVPGNERCRSDRGRVACRARRHI